MAIQISTLIGFIFLFQDAFSFDPQIKLSNKLPCDFLDTINITDGTYFKNKSILFNGVEFPTDLYAKVNYVILRSHVHIQVKPHIRGCLCSIKPCLRLCCPVGTFIDYNGEKGKCTPKNFTTKFKTLDILNENNEKQHVKMDEHFGIVHTFPCKQVFIPGNQYQISHVSDFNQKLNKKKKRLAMKLLKIIYKYFRKVI